MLTLLGRQHVVGCDGLSRRSFLRVGALGAGSWALSLADQLKVPPPVLLIVKVWAAGLTPAWAVKVKLVGLAPMAGATGAAVTVNVTGTVTEEAPGALNITVPV